MTRSYQITYQRQLPGDTRLTKDEIISLTAEVEIQDTDGKEEVEAKCLEQSVDMKKLLNKIVEAYEDPSKSEILAKMSEYVNVLLDDF